MFTSDSEALVVWWHILHDFMTTIWHINLVPCVNTIAFLGKDWIPFNIYTEWRWTRKSHIWRCFRNWIRCIIYGLLLKQICYACMEQNLGMQ